MSINKNDVIKVLMTMGVMYDKTMNEDAGEMFLNDLDGFSYESILDALKSCRLELNKFPTVADIILRVQKKDGRPGIDEAWSMIPRDESASVVWTEEMKSAWSVASPLMSEDMIAARMAFKEKYEFEIKNSRAKNIPVKWSHTFGYDKMGREKAILDAVEKNRLTIDGAKKIMPEIEFNKNKVLIGSNSDANKIQKLIGETFK